MSPDPILAITGDLTIYHAAELRQTLLAALAEQPDQLALDLSGVAEVDSAGLQLLLATRRSAEAAGCSLLLRHPSASLVSVWKKLGLALPVERDDGDAASWEAP